jgi:hypothetical protein
MFIHLHAGLLGKSALYIAISLGVVCTLCWPLFHLITIFLLVDNHRFSCWQNIDEDRWVCLCTLYSHCKYECHPSRVFFCEWWKVVEWIKRLSGKRSDSWPAICGEAVITKVVARWPNYNPFDMKMAGEWQNAPNKFTRWMIVLKITPWIWLTWSTL